jgi:hypothetical protein
MCYGHLVGVIMRKSKVSGRRGTICNSYNVAWEFSALGESSLHCVVPVNASIVGSRAQQIRSLEVVPKSCWMILCQSRNLLQYLGKKVDLKGQKY